MPFKALTKHSLFESDTLNNLILNFILEVYQNLYIQGMISILEDLTSTTNPLSNPTVHPQVVAHVPQASDSRMIVRESDTLGLTRSCSSKHSWQSSQWKKGRE